MKISETTSFPHPVLAPWLNDIADATIDTRIAFLEEGDGFPVAIHCNVKIDHPDICRLLQDGSALFGCFIKCQDTGLRRLQRFGFPIGTHQFAPGALLGRVQLRPVVWAASNIYGYKPHGAHSEFSGEFDINPGQILALDDEQTIEVTRAPLPALESIFEIVSSAQVEEGRFEVDTECDRITVLMGEKTYRTVQGLRQSSDMARDVVMNSLYVPIVMQVLDHLREGYDHFEQYRWLHPFRARCESAGVDIENVDLINDAQLLLDLPFSVLQNLIESDEGLS